jgi:hypothetical protein
MGKVANGRLGPVALAASALGLLTVACSHAGHSDRTGVDVTVTVPADAKVRELTFQLIGHGAPIVGHWSSPQPQHQFQWLITHVPPAEDYHLVVTARSIDQKLTCMRELKVSVGKNALTRVHAALACTGGDGSVVISVGVACTKMQLATYTVSPLAATVGGTITLSAMPLVDAGGLEYLWTASAGAFEDPEAEQTTYRCERAGHFGLNLLVVAPDVCQENHGIEIDCLGSGDAGAKDATGG